MFELSTPRPQDAAAIEVLLDQCFGVDRHAKVSYRYRRDVSPIDGLSLVAREGHRLVGSIRYWPIRVGHKRLPALLLGPLAIAPDRRGHGVGAALIRNTIDLAAWGRHRLVLLVGDPPYYARFGFRPAAPHGIVMPDESGERLLYTALDPTVLAEAAGPVLRWTDRTSAMGPAAGSRLGGDGVRGSGTEQGLRPRTERRRSRVTLLFWLTRPQRASRAR